MALLAAGGDNVVDGKALDGSGVSAGQGAPPDYVVSFPRQGTYTYLCSIHPGMKGKVKVLPKGAKAPSRARTRRRSSGRSPGRSSSPSGSPPRRRGQRRARRQRQAGGRLLRVLARRPLGQGRRAVTFEMAKGSTEMHNVVFGPQDVLEATAARVHLPERRRPRLRPALRLRVATGRPRGRRRQPRQRVRQHRPARRRHAHAVPAMARSRSPRPAATAASARSMGRR